MSVCVCGKRVLEAVSDSGARWLVEPVRRVFVLDKDAKPHLVLAHFPDLAVDHWCTAPKTDKP